MERHEPFAPLNDDAVNQKQAAAGGTQCVSRTAAAFVRFFQLIAGNGVSRCSFK